MYAMLPCAFSAGAISNIGRAANFHVDPQGSASSNVREFSAFVMLRM
jgi:hypothetical protein